LVRSYAIETLSDAPDEELRLYLLQLVQALKYEEDVSGGVSGSSSDVTTNAFSDKASSRISSLSAFLIERASHNIELANFLYWYLRAEIENPIYEARYREVFLAFQEKLSSVRVCNGSIIPQKETSSPESTITLWELLSQQERFISGILDCQKSSLDVRGKKDAKETHLREALEAGGFHKIPNAVPLPSAPHIWITGVNCQSAKMFKSALYPAVLDFIVDHKIGAAKSSTEKSSKDAKKTMCKVMIKTGDDLRQDQLVIMMIQLMDRLLKRGTLDLW
jgi:phosphatidylinositol 3-kinase